MGTLVPINMRESIAESLENVAEANGGSVDQFVATELGYKVEELPKYFKAEQIDALALAIDNIKQGKGFIIGDQTGIGKGRVNAAMILWALENDRIPIFVTQKPNLYADMYRDLRDIGFMERYGRSPKILVTNAGFSLALSEDGKDEINTKSIGAHTDHMTKAYDNGLKDYDMVFTTYDQMNTVNGGDTARRKFIKALAPRATLILDESHTAGGTQKHPGFSKAGKMAAWERKKERALKKGEPIPPMPEDTPDRAEFARELVGAAKGVFYSSATYAKRPDVMDLYAATDMKLAVQDITKLGEAISKGGVPMQQVVAAMLAKSGQYIRRERSFAGINYNTPMVKVDAETYDEVCRALFEIHQFSELVGKAVKAMDKELKAEAKGKVTDNATGNAGAQSTAFSGLMHNIVSQMLLAMKAPGAADLAIEAIKAGEKPVITVANTMESFYKDYAVAMDLKAGDPITATFKDVLLKYLDRSRIITIKEPFGKESKQIKLSNAQLGPEGVRQYNDAKEMIEGLEIGSLPVSPIDAIKQKIEKAGYKIGEITGRGTYIDYHGDTPILRVRPGDDVTIKGRLKTINGFNNGTVDAIILNQAGATGVSLHAGEKFKDKRKRRMILAQPEANIDTHMQMLGRVNRTGQVTLPEYDQLVADIPAEKRPAAVLAKKMASLNANTTASRGGAMTAKDIPDFLNEYGDQVAAEYIAEDVELNERLGAPVKFNENGSIEVDDAMRKLTGRIPLLPLSEQEALYEHLEHEYDLLLKQKEATGENALEAKTLDLQAKVLEEAEVVAAKTGSNSPFGGNVVMKKVSVRRLQKPHPSDEVVRMLAAEFDFKGEITKENASARLKEIADLAYEATKERLSPSNTAFAEFKQKQLDKIEDPKKQEAERAKLDETRTRWGAIAGRMAPGKRILLKTDEGNVYGVVVKIEQKGKPKNPLALSTWKVTLAVADAAQQVTVPFSKLYPSGGVPKDAALNHIEYQDLTYSESEAQTLKRFDELQSASREDRYIATGNLLAAYDYLGSRGRIIHYTDEKGGVQQGILTPHDFDFEKHASSKDDAIFGDDALKWVKAHPREPLWSQDQVVRIFTGNYDRLHITISGNKRVGGIYFLNRELTDVTGDFYKAGPNMVTDVEGTKARKVIEVLEGLGVQFVAKSENRPVMKKAKEKPDEPSLASLVPASPMPGFFSTVERVVEGAKQESASASQWLGTIKNAKGVKQEELDWLGLEDWLNRQKGPVPKEELLDFVRANQIEIREVFKSRDALDVPGFNAFVDAEYERQVQAAIDHLDDSWGRGGEYDAPMPKIEIEPFEDGWSYTLDGDEAADWWQTKEEAQEAAEKDAEEEQQRRQERLDRERDRDIRTYIDLAYGEDVRPKWSEYTEDGPHLGYRELLLTIPDNHKRFPEDGTYHSPHWDERNVLLHTRFTERHSNNKRVLFVEEIQSDWHQEGRERGYGAKSRAVTKFFVVGANGSDVVEGPFGGFLSTQAAQDYINNAKRQEDALKAQDRGETPKYDVGGAARRLRSLFENIGWPSEWKIEQRQMDTGTGVPNAPFKTTWPELALKRLLRYAAENGYDRIAWTPGYVQNERYSLEKHIDYILYKANDDGTFRLSAVDRSGKGHLLGATLAPSDIEGFVGKDVASLIASGEGFDFNVAANNEPAFVWKRIDTVGLKTGGEGMREFYDRMLPAKMNRIVKAFGAKVEKGDMTFREDDVEAADVPYVDITPEMRQAAMKGLPLFDVSRTARVERMKAHVRERRADLENGLRAVIQKIAGKEVNIEFADTLPLERAAPGYGSYSQGINTAGGLFIPGRDLIKVALQDLTYNPLSNAFHEAFHSVEFSLLTDAEISLLEAETGRLRRFLVESRNWDRKAVSEISPVEVRAIAFETYANLRADGQPADNLRPQIRAIFEKLFRLFAAIRNFLNRQGFQTFEDIFEKAYQGEYGQRPGRNPMERYRELQNTELANVAGGRRQANFESLPKDWRGAMAMRGISWPARVGWALEGATLPLNEAVGDTLVNLRRLQVSAAVANGNIPESLDAYQAATIYSGRTEKRLKDFTDRYLEAVREMRKAGLSMEDMHDYLYARHAPERNARIAEINPEMQDAGSGMSDADAAAIMARLQAEGKIPALERFATRFDAFAAESRGLLISSGLESDETIRAWEEAYNYWMPLRGFEVGDQLEEVVPYLGKGYDVRGPESKMALGRYSRADNVLTNLYMAVERAIIRSEKNRVGKTFLRFVRQYPNPALYTLERTKQERRFNRHTGLVETYSMVKDTSAENMFAVKVGGETVYIEIKDAGLLRSIKSFGASNLPLLLRMIGRATRELARFRTARNPEFFIANFLRDVQDAGITLAAEQKDHLTREFMKNVGSMRTFIGAALYKAGMHRSTVLPARLQRVAQLAEQWELHGGQVAQIGYKDLPEIRKELRQAMARAEESFGKKVLMAGPRAINPFGGTLIKSVEFVNDVLEAGTRIAVFDAAIKVGLSPAKAAVLSKEATTNFNRRGAYTPAMNSLYMFFGARVQGGLKIVRLFRRSKTFRRTMMGLVGTGFASTLWNLHAAPTDDENKSLYEKRPYWERETKFVLYLPGEKQPYTLPMGFMIRLPFMVGENAAMVMMGKVSPLTAAVNIVGTAFNAFSPIGSEGSYTQLSTWLRTVLPSVLVPGYELVVNENWIGRPIHPKPQPWTAGEPRSQQQFSTTAPYAIELAQFLNRLSGGNAFRPGSVDLYPGDIDYTINYIFGGLGAFSKRSYRYLEDLRNGIETPAEYTPILRLFRGPNEDTIDREAYYKDRQDVTESVLQTRRALKALGEGKNVEEAQGFVDQQAARLGLGEGKRPGTVVFEAERIFKDAQAEIKLLQAEERGVRLDPAVAPRDKGPKIEAIRNQIRDKMKDARKARRELEKAQ
jgi:hypothetical protein